MSKRKSYRPKPNFFWSILSVSGVLFLVGVFGMISIHSTTFMDSLKEEFEIFVDVGLLSQVYANLFSNAAKYTSEVVDHYGNRRKALGRTK